AAAKRSPMLLAAGFRGFVTSEIVVPSVAFAYANRYEAEVTLNQSIGPFQCETSTPFAYVAPEATAAPPAEAANEAKTSAASSLPRSDPTSPSLDQALFGTGK